MSQECFDDILASDLCFQSWKSYHLWFTYLCSHLPIKLPRGDVTRLATDVIKTYQFLSPSKFTRTSFDVIDVLFIFADQIFAVLKKWAEDEGSGATNDEIIYIMEGAKLSEALTDVFPEKA